MDDTNISHYLSLFNFSALFIDALGWNRYRGSWPIRVMEAGHLQGPASPTVCDYLVDKTFTVHAVAQKKGVYILHCKPLMDGKIPSYSTRCRIQHEVAKLARENVVIFTNQSQTLQIWQWVRRVTGEVPQHCEHEFQSGAVEKEGVSAEGGAEPLSLRLRHLTFSLADEEQLTLTEVTQRLRRAFYNYRNKDRRGSYSRVRLYEYDIEELPPSVQFWVQQVYAEPRPSHLEEIDLARRMVSGDDSARQKLIRSHLYVVAENAWRLYVDNDLTDDEFSDLVQRGNVILVQMADKFDYRHGTRFQGFASLLIASRLSYAVTAKKLLCDLPRNQVERLPRLLRLWEEAEDHLYQQLERQPTEMDIATEISPKMALPPKEILRLHLMVMPASPWELECEEWEALEDDEEAKYALAGKMKSISIFLNQSPSDAAVNLIRREQLDAVLNKLSPRERDVVRMRFGLEDGDAHTLEEVGQRYAVTRERVRQIELRALKKLRRMEHVDIRDKPTGSKFAVLTDCAATPLQDNESADDPEIFNGDCDAAI